MRIISINLNGIRSAAQKGFFDWLALQQADLICLQELKAQPADLSPLMRQPDGYYGYFHCAEKKGYSGVGIYSKRPADEIVEGLGHADIDAEGRYLAARFGNLTVISLYLPSGSSGEARQTVKFSVLARLYPHLQALRDSGQTVVLCGDWNIAHQAIDLKNWRGNQKNSGFLPAEREWFSQMLNEQGWVDVYRKLHPETTDACYTWWSNRGQAWAKNVGWRIDYQIASPDLAGKATACQIYKAQRFSDHAPLCIDYDWAF